MKQLQDIKYKLGRCICWISLERRQLGPRSSRFLRGWGCQSDRDLCPCLGCEVSLFSCEPPTPCEGRCPQSIIASPVAGLSQQKKSSHPGRAAGGGLEGGFTRPRLRRRGQRLACPGTR